ncbi:uncharacterized protein N7484_002384 [Penicillium longicatenatum]|uniref:uncharacterized protein n=1 Tax=Penicillium longicatenatum TaxID=1561947 RepID=UPI002546CD62|nr:uncharacterized protein N7484_002384 [Penicillium longicatenatum]KAJ5658735.1 hypothetical protein N7484_002384 [Penicillium longicatenatum]
MTLSQELASWYSPSYMQTSHPPQIGGKAPSSPRLAFPADNGNPTLLAFLRHCGCPVAEVALLEMRTAAAQHPDINFVAISHSDQQSTEKWLSAVGGAGSVTIIVDADREIYAKWGLGVVPWGHVLSPSGMLAVFKMGQEKGIWNRPTESGSRWQSSGYWAVDERGFVRWGGPAATVDEVVDTAKAIEVLRESRQD